MLIELKRLGAQKLLQILAFLIILTSCMSINDKHGYFPLEKDIDQLIIGKTNKAQVIKIIGPAAISDGASWIYISSNIRSTAFFDPAVTDRNILFLEFTMIPPEVSLMLQFLSTKYTLPILFEITFFLNVIFFKLLIFMLSLINSNSLSEGSKA